MHHERRYLLRPLLHYYGRKVHRWSIIFIERTISLVLTCVYLLTLVVFISYFTIDAHDTHQLHKLHLMHLLQTTIWTAAVYDHFLQHTNAASPSAYIYHSIDMREVFSINNFLATQSKCIHQEKNIVQRDAPIWVMPLCDKFVISMWLWMIFAYGYPMQYEVLQYCVGSYYRTQCRKCSMQPRLVKETIVGNWTIW